MQRKIYRSIDARTRLSSQAIAVFVICAVLYVKVDVRAQCLPTFLGPSTVPVHANPQGIAAGDVNSDGFADLVVADKNSNDIAVLLGHGDGSFSTPIYVSLNTNSSPQAVALGDFNTDGWMDIAVANNGGNNISVLINNRTTPFSATITNYACPANSHPISILAKDLNGDRYLDLVVANNGSNNVSVFLGTGNGAFGPGSAYSAGSSPVSVAAGDVNNDGFADLAVGNSSTVSVLLNNGSGMFSAATTNSNSTSPAVALADVNRDGRLDLLAAGPSTLNVMLGNGNGTFQSVVTYSSSDNVAIAALDLNHDGVLDVIEPSALGGGVRFLGGADGIFAGSVALGPSTSDNNGMSVADFNNDGKPDIAFSNGNTGKISVLINTQSNWWSISQQPANQSLTAGQTAVFNITITGSGAPFTYLWRRNGVPLSNGGRISGAATTTLSISNVVAGDTGVYDVTVTGICNAVSSDPAVLAVGSSSTCCPGDMNTNGMVEGTDVQLFVNKLLSGGTCP